MFINNSWNPPLSGEPNQINAPGTLKADSVDWTFSHVLWRGSHEPFAASVRCERVMRLMWIHQSMLKLPCGPTAREAGRYLLLPAIRPHRRQADRGHPGGQKPEENGRGRLVRWEAPQRRARPRRLRLQHPNTSMVSWFSMRGSAFSHQNVHLGNGEKKWENYFFSTLWVINKKEDLKKQWITKIFGDCCGQKRIRIRSQESTLLLSSDLQEGVKPSPAATSIDDIHHNALGSDVMVTECATGRGQQRVENPRTCKRPRVHDWSAQTTHRLRAEIPPKTCIYHDQHYA